MIQTKPTKPKRGRKTVEDKKILLRLYVRQSVVDAHGGQDAAQLKCTNLLNDLLVKK